MWERAEGMGGCLHLLCGSRDLPAPVGPRVGSRATPCPRSRGRGRVTPGLPGWGSVEHSVPSVTAHVESVCRVSGSLIYSVFTWPSRSDAFRSQILLQIISSQTRVTHSGRRGLAHGDVGVPSPQLPPAPLAPRMPVCFEFCVPVLWHPVQTFS